MEPEINEPPSQWHDASVSTSAKKSVTRRTRLPRGALTAESIVTASVKLLDDEGIAAFSMPRLGRALRADQTAVYRYFSSKDDLILAVADRLLEEAFEGFHPSDNWRLTLVDTCQRVRTTYLAHPAAATLSGPRITSGTAEMRAADAVIAALQSLGLDVHEAALYYRVIADFALLWSGGLASFRSLDLGVQQAEDSAWKQDYRAVDPERYPHIASLRDELGQVVSEDVFDAALDLLLDSIESKARKPSS